MNTLSGHGYAVRRLKCSPHKRNIIASASYDMTCRIWDLERPMATNVHDVHTEFVLGVDFSLFVPGLVATCAWDERINIFQT
jgi:peroxin-7